MSAFMSAFPEPYFAAGLAPALRHEIHPSGAVGEQREQLLAGCPRALGDDLDPAAWAAPSRTVEPSRDAQGCYADGYLRYRAHVDTARDFWARQARGFARS